MFESRSIEVRRSLVNDVQRELASRVRLRFTVTKPPWWRPWAEDVFTITGPADAVQAALEVIARLEDRAFADQVW